MLTFISEPRIPRHVFVQALKETPLAMLASHLFDVICEYKIDPAIALAVLEYEGGLHPGFRDLYNWARIRRAYKPLRAERLVGTRRGPIVKYRSWEEGLRDWCEIIRDLYVQRLQLVEVTSVLTRMSPGSPSLYYQFITLRLEEWYELGRSSVN
jgi:hypothetical protein